MTHKEFFNILVGNPPPEVELEIEIKCREVKELPDFVIKDYCCDLVKHVKLQDVLLHWFVFQKQKHNFIDTKE